MITIEELKTIEAALNGDLKAVDSARTLVTNLLGRHYMAERSMFYPKLDAKSLRMKAMLDQLASMPTVMENIKP